MISLIVAMDKNRVIGVGNKLPWHLPADLKRFKQLTSGHHVIMGRKTFESIGRPLPGRTNVIVSRQKGYQTASSEVQVVHSLDAAVMLSRGDDEAFIIGGGELYQQSLGYADKLYVTLVETEVKGGDTCFPEIDQNQWSLIEEQKHLADEKNPFAFRYLTFVKKSK